jgi:hypothetical protein
VTAKPVTPAKEIVVLLRSHVAEEGPPKKDSAHHKLSLRIKHRCIHGIMMRLPHHPHQCVHELLVLNLINASTN